MNTAIRYATFTSFFVITTSAAFGQTSNRLTVSQLDVESQQCMTCHDGSCGKQIDLRPVDAPVEFTTQGLIRTINHSIGMLYNASQQSNPDEYVRQNNLNPNIKLIDGKVGCLSCHVAKSKLLASNTVSDINEPARCRVDIEGTKNAFHGSVCTCCHVK